MAGHRSPLEQSFIFLEHICQSYQRGEEHLGILHDVCLNVSRGQSCAIVGASGSGKSTLLNILGLLDEPRSGRLLEMSRSPVKPDWFVRLFQGFES